MHTVVAIREGEDGTEFRGFCITVFFRDGLESLSDISGDLIVAPIIRNLEEYDSDRLPRPLSATAKLFVTLAGSRFADLYPDADLEVSFIRMQDFKPASEAESGR